MQLYLRNKTYWVTGYVGGRRIRRSTGCRDESDARRAAAAIIEEASNSSFTLRDAIALRRADLHRRGCAPRTRMTFDSNARALVAGLGERTPCEALRIEAWVAGMRHNANYQAQLASELRTILRTAHEKGFLDVPIHVPREMTRRSTPQVDTMTREEQERVIERAEPAWLAHLLRLAAETGARAGELLGLRRDEVSFLEDGTAMLKFMRTKTGRARSVPVASPAALLALREQLALGTTYLFESPRTTRPYSQGHVHAAVRAAFERAGLYQPRRGIHTFRRGVLSEMIRRGERLDHAAAAMGHTRAVAERHYLAQGATDALAVEALRRLQTDPG
jgi:integrase